MKNNVIFVVVIVVMVLVTVSMIVLGWQCNPLKLRHDINKLEKRIDTLENK